MSYELWVILLALYKVYPMKKLFVVLSIVAIGCISCGHVDEGKAKVLVENLIRTIDSGDYAATSKFYSEEFNAGESLALRSEKYQTLREAFGSVQSMQCISVKDSTDQDDRPIVQLIYKVNHTKLPSIEAFSVVSQNGDYKVEQHDIKQR